MSKMGIRTSFPPCLHINPCPLDFCQPSSQGCFHSTFLGCVLSTSQTNTFLIMPKVNWTEALKVQQHHPRHRTLWCGSWRTLLDFFLARVEPHAQSSSVIRVHTREAPHEWTNCCRYAVTFFAAPKLHILPSLTAPGNYMAERMATTLMGSLLATPTQILLLYLLQLLFHRHRLHHHHQHRQHPHHIHHHLYPRSQIRIMADLEVRAQAGLAVPLQVDFQANTITPSHKTFPILCTGTCLEVMWMIWQYLLHLCPERTYYPKCWRIYSYHKIVERKTIQTYFLTTSKDMVGTFTIYIKVKVNELRFRGHLQQV